MTDRKASDDTTDDRRRADPLRGAGRQRSSIVASVAEIVAAYPDATEALLSDAVKRRPDEALRIVVACIKANPAGAAAVLKIVRESPFLKAKITMDNLMGVLLPDLIDLERAERQQAAAAESPSPAAPAEPPEAAPGAEPEAERLMDPDIDDENGAAGDDFTEPVVAALRRAREAALMNQQLQETAAEREAGDPEDLARAVPPLLDATQGPAAWEVAAPSPAEESPNEPDDLGESLDALVEEEDGAEQAGEPEETAIGRVLRLYPELGGAERDDPEPEAPEAPEPDDDQQPAPVPEVIALGDQSEAPAVIALGDESDGPLEREAHGAPEASWAPDAQSFAPQADDDLTFADYLSGGLSDQEPLLFGLPSDPLPGPSERLPGTTAAEALRESDRAADSAGVARGPVPVPPREVTVIKPDEPLRVLQGQALNKALLRVEAVPAGASLWGLVTDDGSFEIVLRSLQGEDRVVARIDDMVRHPEALAEVEIADRKLNLQDLIIGVDLFRPGGPEDPVEEPEQEEFGAQPADELGDDVVADIRAYGRAASDYRGRGDLDA